MTIKTKFRQLALLLGDWCLLYLSLLLALTVRYQHWPNRELWQEHTAIFGWLFILWLTIFYIANLYNLNILAKGPRFTERVLKTIIPTVLLSLVVFYLWPQTNITPKTNLAIFSLIFTVSFLAWRYLWRRNLRQALPRNNVLLIGYDQMANELWQLLTTTPHFGYRPSLLFSPQEKLPTDPISWPTINRVEELATAVIDNKINTVVIVDRYRADEQINQILFSLLPQNLTYLTLSSFYEQLTGKVPLAAIGQLWFLENLNLTEKRIYLTVKRLVDFSLAIICLIISLPLWPLIALLVKISSQGPIIFKQSRVGRNRKLFNIYKFRTMKVAGNDFQPTAQKDSRVTAIGQFLRQTRLDEIPQLLNIIKGEMSFIGPRPERPELVDELSAKLPFYHIRTLIKPGVTGWDQVSGEYHSPSLEDTYKKLQHDLFYLKNFSIYLDLTIVLKTLATVISRQGR